MNGIEPRIRETEFILRLCISDFQRSAEALAELLGVALSEVRARRGPAPQGRRAPSAMLTRVGRSSGALLMNRHILRFLDALEPLIGRAKGAAGQCEISVSCHINDYGRGYVVYCDPILIRRLSEMDASLEVVVHPGTDPETTGAEVLGLGHLPEED
jgi:hypothetical protein